FGMTVWPNIFSPPLSALGSTTEVPGVASWSAGVLACGAAWVASGGGGGSCWKANAGHEPSASAAINPAMAIDLRIVLLRWTRMTSRARQCKPNGIRVNALLGLSFSESSREPVAAAQHRLGVITGVKKSRPRRGGLAQLLGRGSFCF